MVEPLTLFEKHVHTAECASAKDGAGEGEPSGGRSFPELRARYHALRRQALVDAAAEIVVNEGHAALTSQRLVAELGCSVGALYRMISSIDEVRDDVLAVLLARQNHRDPNKPQGEGLEDDT